MRVVFPYNPLFVEKIKTIKGRRWYPEGKYWSFFNTNGTLEKILNIFTGEKIKIAPELQARIPNHVIARDKVLKQSQIEDLRRELLLRKYSYKTIKSYIYFNRKILRFTDKNSDEINESDVKNYLLHLAERKRFATPT